MTNRPLTLPLVFTGTPTSAPCTDGRLSLRASLEGTPLRGSLINETPSRGPPHELLLREGCGSEHVSELTVKTRTYLRPPVKAVAPRPERLPSSRAATTFAVGGRSMRIRPRRRASRTRSPRHPPSVRVNGATQVPSWLGGSTSSSFDGDSELPEMRAIDGCQTYDFDKYPRFVRRP